MSKRNNAGSDRNLSGLSAKEIEHEAGQSRARIESMLDQLQGRLSPDQLMEQAKDYFQKGPGEFGSNLGSIVKENPVPVALAGIGLSWLALAGRRHQPQSERSEPGRSENGLDRHRSLDEHHLDGSEGVPYATGSRGTRVRSIHSDGVDGEAKDGSGNGLDLGGRAKSAGEGAKQATRNMGERLGSAGSQARDYAGQAQDQAGRTARQAKNGFMRLLTDQPLVVAGIGVALGALLGAAFPSTEQEDEIMGEASDGLKEKAQAAGHEKMEEAQETVARKVDEAGEQHQEEDGDAGHSAPAENASAGTAADPARSGRMQTVQEQ